MVTRSEFSTRDPERALPVLGEFFPGLSMSNPRGQFSFEFESAENDLLSLVHYHLISPASSSSVNMTGTLTIGQVESGNVGLTTNRREIDTSQPWLFPQHPVRGDWDDVTMTALAVSIPALVKFARAQLGDDTFNLGFTNLSPIDPAHGRELSALVTYVRTAFIQGSLAESELVKANLFAHVSAVLLGTFASSFMDATEHSSDPRVLPSAIRRAVTFIEDNAQLPITVEDIALAARLSVRGLQYAFHATLDTTPTAYLRRVRMAEAHRQLELADPGNGGSVGEVAAAWGFSHPGRFAKQYRAIYGVPPKRTFDS